MDLKKAYEEMPDEELLERYEKLHTYFDDAKLVIIEEVKKRKLKTEEEISEKLKKIQLIKEIRMDRKQQVKTTKKNKDSLNEVGFIEIFNATDEDGKFIYEGVEGRIPYLPDFLGIFLIIISLSPLFMGIASIFWPFSEGEIISISNKEIFYTYSVDGAENIGNNVYFGIEKYGTGFIDKKKYKIRDKVKVYYNPSNQTKTTIERGVSYGTVTILIIGFLFLYFGESKCINLFKNIYLYIIIFCLILYFLPKPTI